MAGRKKTAPETVDVFTYCPALENFGRCFPKGWPGTENLICRIASSSTMLSMPPPIPRKRYSLLRYHGISSGNNPAVSLSVFSF